MSVFRDLLMLVATPKDTHTILLLHGNEFVDASKNNRPITYSNVSIENDGKFDKCFSFTSSTSSYLYTPNFDNFSQGNWTLEWWEKWNTTSQSDLSTVGFVNHNNLSNINSGSAGLFTFSTASYTSDLYTYMTSNGSSWDVADYQKIGDKSTNWIFRTVVRDNQYIRFYANGILQKTINMGNSNINTNFVDIMMGNTWRTGFNGKICEFRLSDIARYTYNFTPPTEPFN